MGKDASTEPAIPGQDAPEPRRPLYRGLLGSAAAVALLVAGGFTIHYFSTRGPDTPDAAATASATTSPTVEGPSVAGAAGPLTIVSSLLTDPRQPAANQLVQLFDQWYPNVIFPDSVLPTSQLEIAAATGETLDVFQDTANGSQSRASEKDLRQAVDDLYQQFGLDQALPQDMLDWLGRSGHYYAVPFEARRTNLLYASPSVLQQAGLDAAAIDFATVSDFIAALEQVRASQPNVVPLAIGSAWGPTLLLENVLLAELGATKYTGLFTGATGWTSTEVTDAIGQFTTLMGYTNPDRDEIEWDTAAQMVADGAAAFTLTGDWAAKTFGDAGLVAGTDYLVAPSPGTQGSFGWAGDAFFLSATSDHPAAAQAWLDVVASPTGQAAYNQVAGGIPARTDADLATASFSTFQQAEAADWATQTLVPSFALGTATTSLTVTAAEAALFDLLQGATDVAGFQAALAAAIPG
jgi:glucose/mannose transport system substrate-binding protein